MEAQGGNLARLVRSPQQSHGSRLTDGASAQNSEKWHFVSAVASAAHVGKELAESVSWEDLFAENSAMSWVVIQTARKTRSPAKLGDKSMIRDVSVPG